MPPLKVKPSGDGMKYNPDIHHRRSIRLRDYDYSQAGLYFVTICTQGRRHLFAILWMARFNSPPPEKWCAP
jgi:hypothetical protein